MSSSPSEPVTCRSKGGFRKKDCRCQVEAFTLERGVQPRRTRPCIQPSHICLMTNEQLRHLRQYCNQDTEDQNTCDKVVLNLYVCFRCIIVVITWSLHHESRCIITIMQVVTAVTTLQNVGHGMLNTLLSLFLGAGILVLSIAGKRHTSVLCRMLRLCSRTSPAFWNSLRFSKPLWLTSSL